MHISNTPQKSLARHELDEARKRDSETVEQFDARLRELAIDCGYSGTIDDRLRDQLINGIKEDALKKKLLGSQEDFLADLLKKAHTFEQVARDVRLARQNDASSSKAHYVKQSRAPANKSARSLSNSSCPPSTKLNSANTSRNTHSSSIQPFHPCLRCGSTMHSADACQYRDKECYYCNGIGHQVKVCNRAARDLAAQLSSKPHSSSNSINRGGQHLLKSKPSDSLDGSVNTISFSVDTVGLGKQPAVFVSVQVNRLSLRMELNTGSDNSVVGSKVWKELGSPKLHGGPSLTAYGGYALPVLGAISVSVTFKSVQQQPELVVVRPTLPHFLAASERPLFPSLRPGFKTLLESTAFNHRIW